jgi:hypothetical protein
VKHAAGLAQLAEAELLGELLASHGPDASDEERQRARAFIGHLAQHGPAMTEEERRLEVERFRAQRVTYRTRQERSD